MVYWFTLVLCLSAMALVANADMYLHNPRGSNNRLNERGRARNNANRMFDSQNNNRGGYNVGNMRYYAGSKLPIQWTNQHSCNDPNNNCEIIIQYMCGYYVRDGTITSTIPDNPWACRKRNCNTDTRFGMHEDYDYYQRCKITQRNNGLFTADQQLKGKTSKYTRQNSQGTRRGYECPEERDYYPHWNPNPWKDIAVLTNDVSRCDYYKKESQNVKSRWACEVPETYLYHIRGKHKWKKANAIIPINKADCEAISGAKWKEHAAHSIPAPDCQQAPWSRDNHHGNGRNGFMNIYNWTIPDISEESCVLRIRYNISTNDYDSWNTFSDKNGQNGQTTKVDISGLVELDAASAVKRGYVFKNNPTVQPLSSTSNFKLKLALNTAQYGRTFEDRSFSFGIIKRSPELRGKTIHNLNVRGKRGNIVQVYPSVEYDYVPNRLVLSTGDYIHFQWTGSDTNPGNNDGEGRAGTDRSNVVLLSEQVFDEGKPKISDIYGQFGRSYPEYLSKDKVLGFSMVDAKKLAFLQPGSGVQLDQTSPYFDLGPAKVTRGGTYYYMSTRNNNFSNRSQKGKIIVKSQSSDSSVDVDLEAWVSDLDDIHQEDKNENRKEEKEEDTKEKDNEDNKEDKKEDSEKKMMSKKDREKKVMDKKEDKEERKKESENGDKKEFEDTKRDKKEDIKMDKVDNNKGDDAFAKDRSEIDNKETVNENDGPHLNIRRLSITEAKDLITKQGGSMNKGDVYASDFVSIETDKSAPDQQKRWVDLPLKEDTDPSSVTVYHSKDAKTWEPAEVQDLSEDKHLARVKIKSDGLYVARYEKDKSENVVKDEEKIEKASQMAKDLNEAEPQETTWSIDQ